MGWDGSGNFDRTHNFSADASAGINVLASRQDEEWANYKAGLENCVTRDGQNSPSTDLPMAGQKHTNVGAAASVTQYLRVAEFLRSFPIYCAFGGTAEAMSASAQYALTSLTAGVQVLLSCPSVNTTTSVTLGLTGAGTATVVRADGKGPARGQVKGLHRYVHDGANWIITDPNPVTSRILVFQGSASATANQADTAMSWAGVMSAEGFSLSTSAVKVGGGIRGVRIVAYAQLNDTTLSASGNYYFQIYGGSGSEDMEYGGVTYSAGAAFDGFIPAGGQESCTIVAEYTSVAQGDRIRLVYRSGATVTTPTSARASYLAVTAID